ncbi:MULTISPECIES: SCO family protein [Brucella/Ochrobactrum group]|jgi:protein SCO1/2|uniref:SCO family protein n=1 Tax=Brucella pseudintermedia TaxID=370111 RepID=A0ABY5UCL7_9HYPH|nr:MULTISPECIES: SCO family protein [Brucella/Ochrobactrum group]KAB2685267.1 SCO family protein [Brucella pseudintermedia]MCO7725587.1 SCO family protein [Brucella intermedia]NKE76872.1 SCO family protein [Ochrobactrum sp. MC-1LL]TWG98780.1 protein SCO1/2 [Ochrobactrum sp. J50]UWL61075.1 SCO family protein [Brucella pseudintermedia]
MKKFLPIFIIAFIVVIVGAAGLNLFRDKQAAKEPFGGPLNLVTMDGTPFTENDLRAAPAAIFFGFTHCPDVCPTTLYELDGWLKQLGPEAGDIKAYFITVDPERDTQEIMKTYVGNVSDRIIGLTGTPQNIADVIKSYHVYAKKVPTEDGEYTMDHTASVFLLDKGGRFRSTIAYQENPDTALEKLKNLAKGAAKS